MPLSGGKKINSCSDVSLKTFRVLTQLVDLFPVAVLHQGQFMGY